MPSDQKTTVGNAGAGKNVCICMHAHTYCKLVWQAPYQSFLGGVLVNVCIFHERAGYTLVSAFRLLKLTTTHPASGRLLHAFYQSALGTRLLVFMSQQLSGNCWLCNCILQIARSATSANALPLH